MAKGTFGERLKRERELRDVTVDEICSATRIAPKFLEALENEQWQKLPGGVFGRGFVRSIARYLGLSEENLLSEYDLARVETSTPAPLKPEDRIPSPPKWIPVLAVIVLISALVGMVFGGRYAWMWYAAHRAAKKASAVVSIPSATASQAGLQLSITAFAAARVQVIADGSMVYDAELPSGHNVHFPANGKFAVTAADFSALLLRLNGQTVTPTGMRASSGTILLTAKDLGQAASGTTQR
jgi:transcriptional regulator with XRE-family HTH domain